MLQADIYNAIMQKLCRSLLAVRNWQSALSISLVAVSAILCSISIADKVRASEATTAKKAHSHSPSQKKEKVAKPAVKGPAPRIRFDRREHDFGTIEEGIDVKCQFRVYNDGQKPLSILSVISTCGCTIPAMKRKTIMPAAFETLTVVMDTSMKQGAVSKEITVSSNDPANPSMDLYVRANVSDPHANLGGEAGVKIFKGRCAACHVALGEGKSGEDLYLADCAMCHSFRGKDGNIVAPSLYAFDVKNPDVAKSFRRVIEEGSPTHRSMPGFAKEKGGPLSKKQIDSLIKYFATAKEQGL